MENNKQTAVEWLVGQIQNMKIGNNQLLITDEDLNYLLNQAKEMEKQQIMMAVKDSWYMAKGSNFQEPQEEQYYNKEYGK